MASRYPEERPTLDDLLSNGFFRSTRASQGASPLPSPRTSQHSFQNEIEPRVPKPYDSYGFPGQAAQPPSSQLAPPIPPKVSLEQRMPTNYESQRPSSAYSMTPTHKHFARMTLPRRPSRRGTWPPQPTVEDEAIAVAKEVVPQTRQSPTLSDIEPPMKGTKDQYPVILEANISAEEAAKVATKMRKEEKAEAEADAKADRRKAEAKESGDRRFVLVSDPQSSSSEKDDGTKKPRRTSTAPLPVRPVKEQSSMRSDPGRRADTAPQATRPVNGNEPRRQDTRKEELKREAVREEFRRESSKKEEPRREDVRREEPRRRLSPPTLEKRRSRQDLPSLQTELSSQPPPFKRSTSAYTYTPKTESPKQTRTPSADCMVSPGRTQSFNPSSKDYFEPNASARVYKDASNRLETPIFEKRRSGGQSPAHSPSSSRPSTPGSEKRWSAGENLAYASAKLSKPTPLSNDGARPINQAERLEREARNRSSRTSSTVSSEQYYLSGSDDSLDDSSDSDRPKKKHHRKHRRHHQSLRVDDREKHHRSSSKTNRTSLEVNPQHSRRASPRSSPRASPNISPSQLPVVDPRGLDRDNRRGSARPVSPNSAYADARAGTLKPQEPKVQQAQQIPQTTQSAAHKPSGSLPVPIPARIDVHSPGETRRTAAVPQYDEDVDPLSQNRSVTGRPAPASPISNPTGQPQWQPASFQPDVTNGHLNEPAGWYRRYSEDVDAGAAPQLPACPRTVPMKGYADWLTLPQCVGFRICPACYTSVIANTQYANHFIPAPMRSSNEEIACDFGSQPWFRIAWLISINEQRRKLDYFYAIAEITRTEKPCLGRHEANRRWYSILDPETGLPVKNFDVCGSCRKSIEALLPPIKGLFIETTSSKAGHFRICDMRFDSKRFVAYFDSLQRMAATTPHPRRGLDTREFVELARRYGVIGECPTSTDIKGSNWWVITQLPEFTVCEECFEEVIRPELAKRKAIPKIFTWKERVSAELSCQMYSDRMRDHFDKAVQEDDYKHLASKARDRKLREIKYKKEIEEARKALKLGKKGAKEEVARLEKDWQRWE